MSAPLIDEQRRTVMLQALWEIEALARALPGLVPMSHGNTPGPSLAVRGIASRMAELALAVMDGVDDDAVETSHIENIVMFGDEAA